VPSLYPIRVLVALDGIAADLIERELRLDADFEVLGRTTVDALLDDARRTQPAFVVLPLAENAEAYTTPDVFSVVQKVKVLSVERSGGRAFLTELVGDVAPADIADTLRFVSAREAL
jgi:hypothetical protein